MVSCYRASVFANYKFNVASWIDVPIQSLQRIWNVAVCETYLLYYNVHYYWSGFISIGKVKPKSTIAVPATLNSLIYPYAVIFTVGMCWRSMGYWRDTSTRSNILEWSLLFSCHHLDCRLWRSWDKDPSWQTFHLFLYLLLFGKSADCEYFLCDE